MKLYYSKGACSLAIRILLHELNITFESEAVNLETKQTATGFDFLMINPKGAVPTIELNNGEVLTENAVIHQYLVQHYHGKHLLPPATDFKHYRVLEWLNFITTDLHKGCSPLFNPKVSEEVKASVFRPILNGKLKYVDHHLKESKFLLGHEFCLADGYLLVVIRWLPYLGIDMTQFPHLTRYAAELKQRPAIQKAMQEEGLR